MGARRNFVRRFRLNLRVFDASAEGSSENFRVFYTGTAYDVIFFKFQGEGQLPQVAPPPGAYGTNVVMETYTSI